MIVMVVVVIIIIIDVVNDVVIFVVLKVAHGEYALLPAARATVLVVVVGVDAAVRVGVDVHDNVRAIVIVGDGERVVVRRRAARRRQWHGRYRQRYRRRRVLRDERTNEQMNE